MPVSGDTADRCTIDVTDATGSPTALSLAVCATTSPQRSLIGQEAAPPLDRNLARQYLERFASHPQLAGALMLLIDAFRDVAPNTGAADDGVISAVLSKRPDSKGPAQQLIYLWYISAFFLFDDKTKANVWVYGQPEHYEQALLWRVIDAHPPMTRGGPYGYWADTPSL